jgi:hypothetical protein
VNPGAGRRRPSPTLIVAIIAVVGAWGGPAVAQSLVGSAQVRDGSLTSRDIRNRSLTGSDFKSNTLTGRVVGNLTGRDLQPDSIDGSDVMENTLSEVPRARQAQRADAAVVAERSDRAAVAGALEGSAVRRVYAPQPAGTGSRAVFELGGLQVKMRCSSSSVIGVTAATTGGTAWIRVSGTHRGTNNSTTPVFAKDDELKAGEEFDVVAGDGDNLAGTLTFVAADESVVKVDFISEGGIAAGRGAACLLAGTAVHASA